MYPRPIIDTLETWTIYSAPFTAGPPNGSVPREELVEETELRRVRVTRGEEVFETHHGQHRWCEVDGTPGGPWFGGFADGDPERLAKWKAQVDPVEVSRPNLEALGFTWESYTSWHFGPVIKRVRVMVRPGLCPQALAVYLRCQARLPKIHRSMLARVVPAGWMIGEVQEK